MHLQPVSDSKPGFGSSINATHIISVVGVLITLGLMVLVFNTASTEVDRRWRLWATDHVNLLERQLDRSIGWLDATHGLYKASSAVTRDEFHEFVAALGVDNRLQAISWVPRISGSELPAYLARMQKIHGADFSIHRLGVGDPVTTGSVQDTYFPVTYIYPGAGNEPALGFDIGSNSNRRNAIEMAIQTQTKTATSALQLVQSSKQKFGFLMLQPFIRQPSDGQQVAKVEGVISAVFDVDNLVNSVDSETNSKFTIEIFDVTDGANGKRIFPASGSAEPLKTRGLFFSRKIAVANRFWQVTIAPVRSGIIDWRYWPAILTLFSGLGGTSFFAQQSRITRRKVRETAWHKARQEELERVNEEVERQRQLLQTGAVKLQNANERINTTNQELRSLTENLSRFLPPDLYQKVFDSPEASRLTGERKILSVLFVDLVGFSTLADKATEDEVISVLNHFYSEMTAITARYNGSINKFMGDGLFAVFGDMDTQGEEKDALRCVNCAVEMQNHLLKLARDHSGDDNYHPVHCHIGIATGECTVGSFGSDARLDYTVVSSTVNLASRLENIAGADEIVISDRTYANIANHYTANSLGEIRPRGFKDRVGAWILDSAKATKSHT